MYKPKTQEASQQERNERECYRQGDSKNKQIYLAASAIAPKAIRIFWASPRLEPEPELLLFPEPVVELGAGADGAAAVLDALDELLALEVPAAEMLTEVLVVDATVLVLELVVVGVELVELVVGS